MWLIGREWKYSDVRSGPVLIDRGLDLSRESYRMVGVATWATRWIFDDVLPIWKITHILERACHVQAPTKNQTIC